MISAFYAWVFLEALYLPLLWALRGAGEDSSSTEETVMTGILYPQLILTAVRTKPEPAAYSIIATSSILQVRPRRWASFSMVNCNALPL